MTPRCEQGLTCVRMRIGSDYEDEQSLTLYLEIP